MTKPVGEYYTEKSPRIVITGPRVPSGAYVLRITVGERCQITFGSFNNGKAVNVVADDYLYVGSAISAKGPSCLANRLIRHATRSGGRPPHQIREELHRRFVHEGLWRAGRSLPAQKRLHWHVDYLLDQPAATLQSVYVLRSRERLETYLSEWLLDDPETFVLARGLGASDTRTLAHLLGVRANPLWWLSLPERIQRAIAVRATLPAAQGRA